MYEMVSKSKRHRPPEWDVVWQRLEFVKFSTVMSTTYICRLAYLYFCCCIHLACVFLLPTDTITTIVCVCEFHRVSNLT